MGVACPDASFAVSAMHARECRLYWGPFHYCAFCERAGPDASEIIDDQRRCTGCRCRTIYGGSGARPGAGEWLDPITPTVTKAAIGTLYFSGFRRVRRSTFTEGAIMVRAKYNRHSRARMAETAKDALRHAAPDAPERIDHRRRCTRHDHRTCCRGSRRSASLPCHTLRKRVEMCHAGSHRRPILNATT